MKGLTKRGAEEGAYPAEEMARSGGELALMWLLQSAYDTSVQLSSDVLTSVSEAAGYGGSTVEGLHRVAPQVFVSVAPALDASQLPEDVRGAQQPMVWNLGERLPAAELVLEVCVFVQGLCTGPAAPPRLHFVGVRERVIEGDGGREGLVPEHERDAGMQLADGGVDEGAVLERSGVGVVVRDAARRLEISHSPRCHAQKHTDRGQTQEQRHGT